MSDMTYLSSFESNFDAVSGIKTVDKSMFDNYVRLLELCKEKSNQFCKILREIGFSSHPLRTTKTMFFFIMCRVL